MSDAPGAVLPEGLVKRLEYFRQWVLPGSPLEDVLRDAADALRNQPTKQSDAKRLDDPTFQAHGYFIDRADEDKEVRIVFCCKPDQKGVLSYIVLDSPDAYEMAQAILKAYDQLEGVT